MKDCAAWLNGLDHIGRKIDRDENCVGAQARTGKHGDESRYESAECAAINGHFYHLHTGVYLHHEGMEFADAPPNKLVIRGEIVSSFFTRARAVGNYPEIVVISPRPQ